jgi:hypothetical protein
MAENLAFQYQKRSANYEALISANFQSFDTSRFPRPTSSSILFSNAFSAGAVNKTLKICIATIL